MENLTNIVMELIRSKREGDYWDFKSEPHDNNTSLLHDIMCLSNSLHKGDRYLIIGVSDPDKGCEIIGLTKGQENRKNQAKLINFLRDKPFVGGLRPGIELETIMLSGSEVDIIKIKDNPHKPYYLTSDFRDRDKCVRANYIYTRVADTNTPINESADLNHIEKMWHQRFGLDLDPTERFKQLLERWDEWFEDFGNVSYAYHRYFPEFRIEISKPQQKNESEPYSEFYPNNSFHSGQAKFKYKSNTLFDLYYIYCDDMRIMLANPSFKTVNHSIEESQSFYYYDLSTLDGAFLQFLLRGNMQFNSRGSSAPFLIFENEDKVNEFAEYLRNNTDAIDSLKPVNVPNPSREAYRRKVSLEFLCKAKMMFDKKYPAGAVEASASL